MPWKECQVMVERLRFVARLLEGEKMAPLCAAFGISRKTGYKRRRLIARRLRRISCNRPQGLANTMRGGGGTGRSDRQSAATCCNTQTC